MKWSIMILSILLGASLGYAQVEVEDVGLSDISALENYDPTVEIDQEMATADEVTVTSPVTTDTNADSLIPQQPPIEVVAEPVDFTAPSQDNQSMSYDSGSQISATMPSEYAQKKGQWYMTGIFGSTDYNQSNMDSENAIGFAVGTKVYNNFIVEGSLLFSTIFSDHLVGTVNEYYEKLEQFNVAFAVKVPVMEGQIFSGRVQPELGVIASYTKRDYSEQSKNGYLQGRQDASTNAFDAGFSAGVDFNITKNFAIGFDYKYMFNLAGGGTQNTDYQTSRYGQVQKADPVEEINYTQLGMNAKFKF